MENLGKCPKCGADATITDEQLAPKKPFTVWIGYIFIMAIMTWWVYHYGSMPVTAGHTFEFYAFMILWAVCLIAYPIVMSAVYKKRVVKVMHCAACEHVEVLTPLPSGAKEWDTTKKAGLV